jgi:predicted small lipoprotein YifL
MMYNRGIPVGLVLLLLLSLTACGSSGEDAAPADASAKAEAASTSGFQQTGTITARLDGNQHTWTTYAAPGDDAGTARWTMQLSVPWANGGAETAEAGLLGYADGFNQGGHFEVNFTFEPPQDRARYDLGGPASAASIHYRPDSYQGTSYSMTDGTLQVTAIDARKDGPSQFAGTFSGTFTAENDSGQTLTVTDGSFDIQQAGFEE